MRWSGCTSRSKGVSLGGGNEAWVDIGSYTKYLNWMRNHPQRWGWAMGGFPLPAGPTDPSAESRDPRPWAPRRPRLSQRTGIGGHRALPAGSSWRWMRLSGTANLKRRQRGHFTGRSSGSAGGRHPLRARPGLPPGQLRPAGEHRQPPEPPDQPAPRAASAGPSGGIGERELFPIRSIRETDRGSPGTGRRGREAAKMVARAAACRACAGREAAGWRRGRGLGRAERCEG